MEIQLFNELVKHGPSTVLSILIFLLQNHLSKKDHGRLINELKEIKESLNELERKVSEVDSMKQNAQRQIQLFDLMSKQAYCITSSSNSLSCYDLNIPVSALNTGVSYDPLLLEQVSFRQLVKLFNTSSKVILTKKRELLISRQQNSELDTPFLCEQESDFGNWSVTLRCGVIKNNLSDLGEKVIVSPFEPLWHNKYLCFTTSIPSGKLFFEIDRDDQTDRFQIDGLIKTPFIKKVIIKINRIDDQLQLLFHINNKAVHEYTVEL